MTLEWYRGDPQAVIAALTDANLLAAYLSELEAEYGIVVEPAMQRHCRTMQRLTNQLLTAGLESVSAADPVGCNQLLTDCFAVATWHGWNVPVASENNDYAEPNEPPTGFLGSADQGEGAALWVHDNIMVLARNRRAGDQADLRPHWSGQ